MDALNIVVTALLYGLLASVITYLILWITSFIFVLDELTRRRISAIIGAIVVLLILVERLL